jgi:hypothetical protein
MIEESAIPSLKRCWAILLPSPYARRRRLEANEFDATIFRLCPFFLQLCKLCYSSLWTQSKICKIVNSREKGGISARFRVRRSPRGNVGDGWRFGLIGEFFHGAHHYRVCLGSGGAGARGRLIPKMVAGPLL